ncbi:MAG: hypothetical protein RI897_4182 [Verrucomicrobiota bacterium]
MDHTAGQDTGGEPVGGLVDLGELLFDRIHELAGAGEELLGG